MWTGITCGKYFYPLGLNIILIYIFLFLERNGKVMT